MGLNLNLNLNLGLDLHAVSEDPEMELALVDHNTPLTPIGLRDDDEFQAVMTPTIANVRVRESEEVVDGLKLIALLDVAIGEVVELLTIDVVPRFCRTEKFKQLFLGV